MPAERFIPSAPKLKLEPLLRFQRYRDLDRVAPAIREVGRDMLHLAENLAAPDVVFIRKSVDSADRDALRLVDGPTFHGRCFQTHLAEASEVICFVCTIGAALDERVTQMTESDELLEALFVETAGWLAIEDALRKFRSRLTAELRPKGRRLSPRLAPGFMDWALTEQPELFSVFSGAPLPVSLSEYCVMTPKKSISGLFGVLPAS
jgi:hypothetical protein